MERAEGGVRVAGKFKELFHSGQVKLFRGIAVTSKLFVVGKGVDELQGFFVG
jgi:hypothetical protein